MPRTNHGPCVDGEGELRLKGDRQQVRYEIRGEPRTLALGRGMLRGAMHTTIEVAERAFRQGDGVLTLAEGSAFRLTMLGHSSGSSTVYFEMRV